MRVELAVKKQTFDTQLNNARKQLEKESLNLKTRKTETKKTLKTGF